MVGFVAYEIVLPALHEFYRDHPDVEICIETSESLVDLRTGVLARWGPTSGVPSLGEKALRRAL